MCFYREGGEMRKSHKSPRVGGSPIPGDVKSQAWWGSEQPDVVVPVQCRGVGLDGL